MTARPHRLRADEPVPGFGRALLFGGIVALAQIFAVQYAAAQEESYDEPEEKCNGQCDERGVFSTKAGEARGKLALGDAELAVGNLGGALSLWQEAVDIGRAFGAQASVTAQKRIQLYTLTTRPDDERLRVLENEVGGTLLNTKMFQHALKALGYFEGPENGVHGVLTRSAIRKFQRDMAFDETDDLSARQIVYLIGNGAETARDPETQTTLALMYAGGMGLPQRADFALAWLRAASSRLHGEATYYLAIMHGTGHCHFPKRLHLANQYLREAAFQKNATAADLLFRFGKDWTKIAGDSRVKASLRVIGDCSQPKSAER